MESTVPGAWRALATSTAIAGIIFALLYTLSYWLLANTPLGSAADAEILAYYGDSRQRTLTLAGMFIMPFAGISFLYFRVLLRLLARKTGFTISRMLANVQLAAGTIFIGLLFVATAGLTATTALETFDIGIDLGLPVALDYHERMPFAFNGTIEKVHIRYIGDREGKARVFSSVLGTP